MVASHCIVSDALLNNNIKYMCVCVQCCCTSICTAHKHICCCPDCCYRKHIHNISGLEDLTSDKVMAVINYNDNEIWRTTDRTHNHPACAPPPPPHTPNIYLLLTLSPASLHKASSYIFRFDRTPLCTHTHCTHVIGCQQHHHIAPYI